MNYDLLVSYSLSWLKSEDYTGLSGITLNEFNK